MNRKRIPGRRDGELCEKPADFTPVIASMCRDMQKHFPSAHAASISIGEDKWQSFRQEIGAYGLKIFQVPLIRGGERSMKLRKGGRLGCVVFCVTMFPASQMCGKNPGDDKRMVHQSDRDMAFLTMVSDMKPADAGKQVLIRPRLILEQRSQQ